ncbi:hypothetical protein LTR50_004657 [Elasticomyces elasticus]|nr:hypothetical protein LTR50_004657 [Elasticomyces elasticus]
MATELGITELNKVRASMGLKPLPNPNAAADSSGPVFKQTKPDDSGPADHVSTLEKRTAAAGDNWKKLQDEQKAIADRQARKEATKKARTQAARFATLQGKGLGDADEDEVDTKTWLLQQKKRQKKVEKARKLADEQAAREQQAEYTAKDLAGVKVAHEIGEFDEEIGEQILTLKDAEIGEEDVEDELENAEIKAKEKLKENLELKKKKPVYDPNDIDETGEKSILKHYDEEINGKKQKRFTLDGQGSTLESAAAVTGDDKSKGVKISLDTLMDDTPISDYVDASTVKIKKPKKRKAKQTRQRSVDEDDVLPTTERHIPVAEAGNAMDIDGPQTNEDSKKRVFEFDDDDLQAQLAQQRRQALKRRKLNGVEELARQIREEVSASPAVFGTPEESDGEGPGLVLDETTEFVANLQRPTEDEQRPRQRSEVHSTASLDGDVEMRDPYSGVEDVEELRARLKRETTTPAEVTATGLSNEKSFNLGVGAALATLQDRNLVQKGGDAGEVENFRGRQTFLAKRRELEGEYERSAKVDRERMRLSGQFANMSAKERQEYERQQNEQREHYVQRQLDQLFKKDYKPDVKLKYTDEYGRSMGQKEAFKHLSHQFHGKGSGKQKTEKRIKKIDDEKKREAMSSLDSSLATGMNSAMGQTARKNRQAGVRLQ